MYLDHNVGLRLFLSECCSLSESILLFDLSLDSDRTLAQRKPKSKVTYWLESSSWNHFQSHSTSL